MQHSIPTETLGPQGEIMAHAVQTCVHCGFCLPACPTYRVLGEEMNSPRGRIFLMKETLEGNLALEEAMPYIDRCLGCVGCVPACPSGVAYGELLAGFRAYAEPRRSDRPASQRAQRRLIRETLPYAGRFRAAATAGRLGKRLASALPGDLGAMVGLLPEELPKAAPLPYFYPAQGARRARVALLVGCVQQALAPEINWATLRVLSRNGVEVIVPQGQGCCGALSMHIGEAGQAKDLARANLAVFPRDVDTIITNAAGCGSGMKEYPALFKGLAEEALATAFAEKVLDISVFLSRLGLVEPPPLDRPLSAAYHDACHLVNAQGVRNEPRQLLSSIPNLTLLEIPEGELCCGSAGTYNLEQPEIAGQLGERKAKNILATSAEAIITGNIGCLTQIAAHLQRLGRPLPIWHTVELLDRSYAQGVPRRE
jgi:glycolate oxidase iron-sulfur subunit